MKKVIVLLISLLVLTMLPKGIVHLEVFANAACPSDKFVLSNINKDKSVSEVGCFDTFEQANNAMKANTTHPDLIITHTASRSPSKIIASNRAIAMSYAPRWGSGTSNSSTADIWRNSNRSGDTTYISSHYDMAYYETTAYNPSDGSGTIKIQTSGFVGYIRLIQTDIIPMIYIEEKWPISLGGQSYNEYYNKLSNQPAIFSRVPQLSEYRVIVNQSFNVKEIQHHVFNFSTGRFSWYTYGLAPNWLDVGTYYSWDSITFYKDIQMKDAVKVNDQVAQYFNYYQYLPLRSSSNYNGKDLDEYLEKSQGYTSKTSSAMYGEGNAFFDAQNVYGVNALLVYALAIHESGHGTSNLARTRNNLFGWGAFDSSPGDAYMFASVTQSVYEHMGRNLRGYLSAENWRYFGQVYGNKNNGFNTKYASDPYWGNKIAGHAYRLDRYHGFKDYGQYQIALVEQSGVISVKDSAATTNNELFSLRNSLQQQVMLVTDVKNETNQSFVEVMSPMPVVNKSPIRFSTTSNQLIEYNWLNSVGYLINPTLKTLYDGSFNNVNIPSTAVVDKLEFVDGKLSIEGYHLNRGITPYETTQLKHKIVLVDTDNRTTSFDVSSVNHANLLKEIDVIPFSVNNMGFKGSLDIANLAVGTYKITNESRVDISTSNKQYTNTSKKSDVNLTATINNKIYTIKSNQNHELVLQVSPSTQSTITDQSLIIFNELNKDVNLSPKITGLTYEVKHPNIASVSASGVVKSLASGSTTITIKQNNEVRAVVGVNVAIQAQSFTVNKNNIYIEKKDQVEVITTTLDPSVASNNEFVFIAQNDKIVSINQEGIVTPLHKGRTKIFVYNKVNPSLVQVINISVLEGTGATNNPPVDNPGTQPNVILGDVNGDGVVDILDLARISRFLAELDVFNENQKNAADINKDGKVDILDLARLTRILAGLE